MKKPLLCAVLLLLCAALLLLLADCRSNSSLQPDDSGNARRPARITIPGPRVSYREWQLARANCETKVVAGGGGFGKVIEWTSGTWRFRLSPMRGPVWMVDAASGEGEFSYWSSDCSGAITTREPCSGFLLRGRTPRDTKEAPCKIRFNAAYVECTKPTTRLDVVPDPGLSLGGHLEPKPWPTAGARSYMACLFFHAVPDPAEQVTLVLPYESDEGGGEFTFTFRSAANAEPASSRIKSSQYLPSDLE